MQGEIQHKPIALQEHRTPLQLQGLAAKAGPAKPKGHAELGPTPATPETPICVHAAPQAARHGRQQGDQRER